MTARQRPWYCVDCGRHEDVAGRISRRGLCINCALIRVAVNAEDIAEHNGVSYAKWQRGMQRFNATLLPARGGTEQVDPIDADQLRSQMMSAGSATSMEVEGG
jgi:hypothetical protein